MANKAAVRHSSDAKRRVVHIITGLSRGGAESVLFRLVCSTTAAWDTVVISLADEGFYGERLRSLGYTVHCCRMNAAGQAVPGFARLLRFLRHSRPDVVQTWMYHADLLGGVAARVLGCGPVVWGIRNLRFYRGTVSWSARLAQWLCARLSKAVPVAIVSCSAQAASEHRRRGYAAEKIVVIPNGYDCEQLRIDKPAGQQLRAAWGILPSQFLIGMVARWDPLKDHANLLAALQLLMREHEQVRCVLVGPGMVAGNQAVSELLQKHALCSKVVLAGPRDDITAVMNALDLHVLCSLSEAFPNVVAEAMACGTPDVVTDVGEAALIIGDTGWCVPPGDPAALHQAMRTALRRLSGGDAETLGTQCRQRIVQNFSQQSMVAAYEDAWSRAIGSRTQRLED
jgi:glycosyltransferase involved in cell wall biosynthesis